MQTNVNVVLCCPQERAGWNTYIENAPGATICHHFLWSAIISQAYGHRPCYLMAQSGNHVRGVLPLFLVKSRLFGKSLTSMPFLDYGGICADDNGVARCLLDHARRILSECGVDFVELRQCMPPYFKQQWGAKPLQIYGQIVSSTGEARMSSPAESAKFQIASEAWKRLPVSVATLIGPRVRKYITN